MTIESTHRDLSALDVGRVSVGVSLQHFSQPYHAVDTITYYARLTATWRGQPLDADVSRTERYHADDYTGHAQTWTSRARLDADPYPVDASDKARAAISAAVEPWLERWAEEHGPDARGRAISAAVASYCREEAASLHTTDRAREAVEHHRETLRRYRVRDEVYGERTTADLVLLMALKHMDLARQQIGDVAALSEPWTPSEEPDES